MECEFTIGCVAAGCLQESRAGPQYAALMKLSKEKKNHQIVEIQQ